MEKNADKRLNDRRLKPIATFGWSFAAGMAMLTAVGLYRGFPVWVSSVTAVLSIYHAGAYLFWRRGLVPSYAVMSRIGHALGFLLSCTVFTLVYYVLFSPVSLALRAAGKDLVRDRAVSPEWIEIEAAKNDPRRIEKLY